MKVVFFAAIAYTLLVALVARKHLPELHPRRFFLETWQAADREAEEARRLRAEAGLGYDWRPLVAFCLAAVILTLQEYFGDRGTFLSLVQRGFVVDWGGGPNRPATHHLTVFGPQAWMRRKRRLAGCWRNMPLAAIARRKGRRPGWSRPKASMPHA